MIRINKPSRSTWGLISVLILLALLSTGIWAIFLRKSDEISDQPTTTSEQTAAEQIAEIKEQPPTITLPGAKPIPARAADYTRDGDIWQIVNPWKSYQNPQFIPPDLQAANIPMRLAQGSEESLVRAIILPDLREMIASANAEGIEIFHVSGYRSYATQAALFSRYSNQYGESVAAQFSARAGHSEHQSGLAVDFAAADGSCGLDDCFGETPAGKWLAENSYKYGFILRYPAGKSSVVGYKYEPWHFRYVGKELAGALKESGLTLEEAWPYLESASQTSQP